MAKKSISRRTLLKGIAAGGATVAIGLPMLDIFCNSHGTALAQGSAFPRRFGVWNWGNGMLPERWTPRTTGRHYELSPQLRGLLPVRDDVTVVTGTIAAALFREAHREGSPSLLAGTPIIQSDLSIRAPTIDVLIANAIGGDTAFRAIYAGVDPNPEAGSSVSANGPGSLNPPIMDPLTLYNQLFLEGFVLPGEAPIIDPTWNLRRSALSAVMEEAAAVRSQLGTHDQRRLDDHLDGFRSIERRLEQFAADPPDLAACGLPPRPNDSYPEVNSRVDMKTRHRIIADLLTMALACDRTRVVHNMFSARGSAVRYPGVSIGHHELSHRIDSVSKIMIDLATQQIIDEYAYFVQALAAVPEGDGRLIDNVAILGTSEIGYGAEHALDEFPILIAGSAGGALVSGEHIRAQGSLASSVSFSLLRALGAGVQRFGINEAETSTGLPGLES